MKFVECVVQLLNGRSKGLKVLLEVFEVFGGVGKGCQAIGYLHKLVYHPSESLAFSVFPGRFCECGNSLDDVD